MKPDTEDWFDSFRDVMRETHEEGSSFGLPAFEKLELIAGGASADVYRAIDTNLKRPVALKVLKESFQANRELRERFLREAHAMARLSHPNIVAVYGAGEEAGRMYIAMELVQGQTLSQALADGRLDLMGKVAILEKVTRGVHYVHTHGVVHRDLKPQNILLGESGEPKVADFGLARLLETHAAVTRPGTALGTPAYMAPEQVAGSTAEISPATDVYALGAILYEALTDRQPHSGATLQEVYASILNKDPLPPRAFKPTLARDLEAIVLKAMEKLPRRRYATAEDLAHDLKSFLEGRPIEGTRRTLRTAIRRAMSSHPLAIPAVAAALLVAAVAIYAVARRSPAERALEELRRREEALKHAKPYFDQGTDRFRVLERLLFQWDQNEDEVDQTARAAEACFKKALEIWPAYGEAALQIARIHFELDQLDLTREWCADAIKRTPELATAYLLRALVNLELYEAQRHDRGGNAGQETLSSQIDRDLAEFERWSPDAPDLVYARAIRHFKAGDLAKALPEFEAYSQTAPGHWKALRWYAEALLHAARWQESIDQSTRSIQLRPRHAVSYQIRGTAIVKLGDPRRAIEDFDRSLQINPRYAPAYVNRGIAFGQIGDYPRAMDDFAQAIQISPNSYLAYQARGALHRALGNRNAALDDFTQGMKLNPREAALYRNRAIVSFELKDFDSAIADWTRAIEIDPNDLTAYADRGAAKLEKSDLDGAEHDLDKAVQLDPRCKVAHFNRGNLRVRKGNFNGAIEDCTQAISLGLNDADPYYVRAGAREALGTGPTWRDQLHAAVADLEKALQLGAPSWKHRLDAESRLSTLRARLKGP